MSAQIGRLSKPGIFLISKLLNEERIFNQVPVATLSALERFFARVNDDVVEQSLSGCEFLATNRADE